MTITIPDYPNKSLLDFFRAVKADLNYWSEQEQPTVLLGQCTIQVTDFYSIPETFWGEIKNSYGDAITLSFRLNENDYERASLTDLATDPQATLAKLRSLVRSPTLFLQLRIDKEALLRSWQITGNDIRVFLYFFENKALKIFQSEPRIVERNFWPAETPAKTVIIVPGEDILLEGEYLGIVGGANLSQQLNNHFSRKVGDPQKVGSVYQQRRANFKGDNLSLSRLTPLHFYCPVRTDETNTFSLAIQVQLTNLVAHYTADYTSFSPTGFIVTYANPSGPVTLKLKTLLEAAQANLAVNYAAWDSFNKIMGWVYEVDSFSTVSSRLLITQEVIGQTLKEAAPSTRYNLLISKSEDIYNSLISNWRSLVENKVITYLTKAKEFEETISKTVSSYVDQVSDIVKSLTETMLTAVAAIVGTMIAALFQDKFNPTVFIIGMVTYAAYLGIIHLFFNLKTKKERFDTLNSEYSERRAYFAELLEEGEITRLEKERIENGQKIFEKWYGRTLWAYWVVLTLVLLAAIIILIVAFGSGNWFSLGSNVPAPTTTPLPQTPLTPTI
jgi:hypothetical protein